MGNFIKQRVQSMMNTPKNTLNYRDGVWEFMMDHAVEDERYGYVIRVATVSRADFERRVQARMHGYRSREELSEEDMVNFERINIAKGMHKTHQRVDWVLRRQSLVYRVIAYVRGKLSSWLNERRQEVI